MIEDTIAKLMQEVEEEKSENEMQEKLDKVSARLAITESRIATLADEVRALTKVMTDSNDSRTNPQLRGLSHANHEPHQPFKSTTPSTINTPSIGSRVFCRARPGNHRLPHDS